MGGFLNFDLVCALELSKDDHSRKFERDSRARAAWPLKPPDVDMNGPQARAYARQKYVERLHRPHRGTSKRYSSRKVIHDILKGTRARSSDGTLKMPSADTDGARARANSLWRCDEWFHRPHR